MPPDSENDTTSRAGTGPHLLHNLWRLRRYVRPYAGRLGWLLIAAFTATGASISVPLVIREVVDGPIAEHDSDGLFRLGALALLFGLAEAALIFVRRWVQSSTALGIESAIRDDIYAHLQQLHVGFHDRWQSGQLLSRITTDLSVIRRFLSFGLLFLIVNTVTYLAVVVLLTHLYWPLGLLVAASAVPLFVVSRRFTRSYLAASRQMQDEQGDLATLVEESTQGLRTIKSFGRQPEMARRFAVRARQLHDTATGKGRLLARSSAEFDLVPNLTLAVVLVAGTVAVARNALTIGELVAFVTLQLMLIWPIESLGWIIANGQEAITAADRIHEVLDTEPTIVDRPHAVALHPPMVRGRLRFEQVAFGYPGVARPVLRDVTLEVEPGETMAIVGATGSGKTTLLSLVPRLYDVTSGRVTLDGRDIRDIRLTGLRRVVGVAFEEPTLFSMSVWENLTLGRPDATEDEVRDALAVVQADFVYDLPWGLATRVGEQGLSLSGGQRQRIALARAILGQPGVLVLDDPLSALDVHTEALVEAALARMLRDTTALLVVHRPSTVALADRVALLADGRIVAVGTHSELLATVPDYRAVLSAAGEPDDSGLIRS
ncbi:ABC transporter ATP-binding protein [Micromonospora sp. NBC_01796]|uniref:ABC transporter ATP-binding protein n=1 Tax=Micromonospora sp. NBC_01796 TaxID=2975987 RepID=UPI002DDC8AE2|nr:ABC transporter ATP-binding protein [Micromonospora sp. NBC_01796]WSA89319.1 ABC transporter ATP-binding protein/permease [Micromonospora sp. NBC_01796]